jgi:hypothetical protein
MYANVLWSLFNLLPVHPFDGGKLMGILFEGVFGRKGLRASYFLSAIFAILLSALCLFNGQICAGALLLLCAFESFRAFRERRYFETTASESLHDELKSAKAAWQQKQPDLAIKKLEDLMDKTKEGDTYLRAKELLAKYLAAIGQNEKAYDLLKELPSTEGEALKLVQLVTYKLKLYKESLQAGSRVFRESQDPSSAIMNAFSAARLEDAQGAINWLYALQKMGTRDLHSVVSCSDFDPIRKNPLFQQFMLRI